MFEHSKLVSKKQHDISEQLKIAITPNMLKEEFDDATVVADDIEIETQGFNIPQIDMNELETMNVKKEEKRDVPASTSKEVDDFFDSF